MIEDILWFVLKLVLPVFIVLLCLRKTTRSSLNYWTEKGIPQLTNSDIKHKSGFADKDAIQQYRLLKSKSNIHGGIYKNGKPTYIALDLELIKNVLIKDFEHFRNRGMNDLDEKHDPLSVHLFHLRDERWRTLRVKLTPTFTSGKMKMMFPLFLDCTHKLTEVLNQCCDSNAKLDIKDIVARFGTDVITSCAFGVECNSLEDPDVEFRKQGRKCFDFSGFAAKFRLLCLAFFPQWLTNSVGISFLNKELQNFFFKAVEDMVSYRENNNVYRPDFMHLLLQLKNREKIIDDGKIFDSDGQAGHFLSKNEFTAQCFVFFVAGFESSSSAMMFALYELAKNQDCQEKLREEVCEALEKHDGKFTYESLAEMTYLEQVIKETFRMYPSFIYLDRVCNKKYLVPGTNVELEIGTHVQIPIWAIQRDPEYYPEPDKFDPERFSRENEAQRHKMTWLPFGEGPRVCIGMRFGWMQMKMSLATIIKDFNIKLDPETPTSLDVTCDFIFVQPVKTILLQLSKAK